MKTITKLKMAIPLLCMLLTIQSVLAQSKADIFDGKTAVTWLGLDYSQARFIGSEIKLKNSGVVTNPEFTKIYIPAWNDLFLSEPKKYNVAKAVHRSRVAYALNITEKANNAIKKDFFTENPKDFKTLTEQDLSSIVKNYDFQGNTGIGMMMFIEGMDKEKDAEGIWVTFVDMKLKTVLYTSYLIGKTGGAGFRNHWADATFRVLQQVEMDNNWKTK